MDSSYKVGEKVMTMYERRETFGLIVHIVPSPWIYPGDGNVYMDYIYYCLLEDGSVIHRYEQDIKRKIA